jgi:hypothetical protein
VAAREDSAPKYIPILSTQTESYDQRSVPASRQRSAACGGWFASKDGLPTPSHCPSASQGFVFDLVCYPPSFPAQRLTSGHAKGFVGVVEISPAPDPAARIATNYRIASMMRGAAPNRRLGGSLDQLGDDRPRLGFGDLTLAVSRSALGTCEEG